MMDPRYPAGFWAAQERYDNQEPPEARDYEQEENDRAVKGDMQMDLEQDR